MYLLFSELLASHKWFSSPDENRRWKHSHSTVTFSPGSFPLLLYPFVFFFFIWSRPAVLRLHHGLGLTVVGSFFLTLSEVSITDVIPNFCFCYRKFAFSWEDRMQWQGDDGKRNCYPSESYFIVKQTTAAWLCFHDLFLYVS